jgi:hypothetical protein
VEKHPQHLPGDPAQHLASIAAAAVLLCLLVALLWTALRYSGLETEAHVLATSGAGVSAGSDGAVSPPTDGGGSHKSGGPQSTRPIPNVVGLSEGQAQAAVTTAGFIPATKATESNQPAGRVVGQVPAGGKLAAAGAHVTLMVSTGATHSPTKTIAPSVETAVVQVVLSNPQTLIFDPPDLTVPVATYVRVENKSNVSCVLTPDLRSSPLTRFLDGDNDPKLEAASDAGNHTVTLVAPSDTVLLVFTCDPVVASGPSTPATSPPQATTATPPLVKSKPLDVRVALR